MILSIEEAKKLMQKKDPKRYKHILGTYETATKLAKQYNVDLYKCQMAALLHDYAKNESIEKMEKIIRNHLNQDYLNHSTNIYHAPVARYLLNELYNIEDKDILNAIEYHVTGHPNMNDIAKVVYISDYIEPSRVHPTVDFCRYLSDISLDLAVLGVSDHTLQYLMKLKQANIHPLSVQTYKKFLEKVGDSYYESIKNNYKRM